MRKTPLARVFDRGRLPWTLHDLGVRLRYPARTPGLAGSPSAAEFIAAAISDGPRHGRNRHLHHLLALGETIRRPYQSVDNTDFLWVFRLFCEAGLGDCTAEARRALSKSF